MADETTPPIEENVSDDTPIDVDFNAVLQRAQAQLVLQGGMAYQANADMRQKLIDFSLTKPVAQ